MFDENKEYNERSKMFQNQLVY